MKKAVAGILLTAVSAISLFAFTACKNDDNEQDNAGGTKYTVTQAEWGTAVKSITDGKVSLKCVWSTEGEKPMFYEHDSVNKALYYFIMDSGVNEDYRYRWVDGDIAYGAESDDDEKIVYELEEYEAELKEIIEMYGVFIIAGDLGNNYNKFTYDEAKKAYTANVDFAENDNFTMPSDKASYTLSFENGKLIKCVVEMEDMPAHTLDYTYGITVTVPDSIKNLPSAD